LRDGGRLAIVFPETYLGMPEYRYVPHWLLAHMRVEAVVGMPEDLFQPYTHNKTCVIFARKERPRPDDSVVMATVRWCGHDSRGGPIPYDDVPAITNVVRRLLSEEDATAPPNCLAFLMPRSRISNDILIPRYYDPRVQEERGKLEHTHELVPLGHLIDTGAIAVQAGVEVGKLAYGTGSIPFVRTSDLANWEIKLDPKQGVSDEIYAHHQKRASLHAGDLLMVRDGTYLVGTTAIVTAYDAPRMLFPSGMLRLRVLRSEVVSPYLLLLLLNSPFVKRQVRSKQFTRGVIDTLGDRYRELLLPFSRLKSDRRRLERRVERIVRNRAQLKQQAGQLAAQVGLADVLPEQDDEPGST